MKIKPKLEISLGMDCNASCVFCQSAKSKNKEKMSYEDAKKYLINHYKDGCREVTFTGGEPTIRKDIFSLISFAKSIGYNEVSITTNGFMLSYIEYVRKLKSSGITKVNVSVFSYGNERYYETTGVANSFDYLKKGLINLNEERIPTDAYILISQKSKGDLARIVNLLLCNGIHSFLFWFISAKDLGAKKNLLIPKFKEIVEELQKVTGLILKDKNNLIKIMHIPICALGKYGDLYYNERKANIILQDKNSCFDLSKETLSDYVKIERCNSCKKTNLCEGLRKDYFEEYGDCDLKTIIK